MPIIIDRKGGEVVAQQTSMSTRSASAKSTKKTGTADLGEMFARFRKHPPAEKDLDAMIVRMGGKPSDED